MRIRSLFNQVTEYMGLWRRLTENEIALAQKIYKDNIDYDKIKLYERRIWPAFAQSGNRAVAFHNNASFPGQTYSEDFTESHIPEKRGVFIHEIGHPWQHQNDVFNHAKSWFNVQFSRKNAFNYQNGYFYRLETDKTLLDYGFEQQAAILQDYYMLKYEGVTESFKGRRLNTTDNPEELLSLYEDVLEAFFTTPTPAYVARYKQDNKIKPINHDLGIDRKSPLFKMQKNPLISALTPNS